MLGEGMILMKHNEKGAKGLPVFQFGTGCLLSENFYQDNLHLRLLGNPVQSHFQELHLLTETRGQIYGHRGGRLRAFIFICIPS